MAHHLSDDEFNQIYQKYYKTVWRVCYGGVFCHQENAEELIDDVFMVLLNKSDHVEPDKYESYLVSVAKKKVKEARRAHVRRPPSADVDEYAEILSDNEPDMVEQILLQKIEAEDLTEEVLSQLKPEDQELIRQIREEGVSRTELAEKHQVTPSALYTKISRLRNRVKTIIQDVLNKRL
jgi:RNA polymerase sigma factor (sigma-70 family)